MTPPTTPAPDMYLDFIGYTQVKQVAGSGDADEAELHATFTIRPPDATPIPKCSVVVKQGAGAKFHEKGGLEVGPPLLPDGTPYIRSWNHQAFRDAVERYCQHVGLIGPDSKTRHVVMLNNFIAFPWTVHFPIS